MEIGSLDFKIAMDSADVEKQLQAIMDKLRAFDNQTSGRLRQTATQAENTKRAHRDMTDDMHKGITSITDDYNKLNNVLGKLQSIGGIAIGGYALGSTIKQVVQTRGEFQQLEIAFSTMLGSGEKAAELMDKITKTAATTPFDLQGVANGAKQLLAYGVSVDEVNEKIVQLGDIAAGMSLPLGDLVYLYGTTMVQGRMFTQDLKQFQGRGIPIAEELAKVLGVTKNEVAGLVTAGKVTAKVFKQAMENMSGAGGKFYNLMEKQSKSLTGQLSNLGDAVDMMYNEIGKKGEKLFSEVIEKISWLVENYKKVGEAILEVITVYGVYKGSLLAVNTLHKAAIAYQKSYAAAQMMSAAAGKTLTTAQLTANASMITLNKGVKALTASLKASSLAALANPYVLLAAAITAVGYAIYKTVTYEDEFQKANRRLQDAVVETNAEIFNEQARISELAETVKTAKEGTDQYKIAKKELLEVAEKYNIKLADENGELDITMMKYNSLQQAVRDYYAEKGRQAFIAAEKENMIEGIKATVKEFQNEALEEIVNDNIDNLSAEEAGKLKAKIAKASSTLFDLLMKGQLYGEYGEKNMAGISSVKLGVDLGEINGVAFKPEIPKQIQEVLDLYRENINMGEAIVNEVEGGMVGSATSGYYRLEYNLMQAAKETKASLAAIEQSAEVFGVTGLTLPETKTPKKKETETKTDDKEAEKKRKKAEQDLKKAEAEALQHRKAIEQIADENEDAIKDDTYQNRIDKLNKENERIIKAIGENADKYVEASVAAAKKRAEAQGKKLSDKEVETARETARKEITTLQTKAVETQGNLMERQEGDLLQDSVNRYIQYYQKLMELERQYNEDKNAVRTQEEKDVVEANYKNEKANLETAMQKEYGGESNDAFGEFADKIQTMGLKKVADEIKTVQQAIAKLNQESGGKFSKEYATKLANLNAKLAIANLNFEKLTEKQRKNRETHSEVGKYWNKLSNELKDVASDFRAIGENWSETMANVLDTASVTGDSVMTIISGIVQLTNISVMSIETTSKTAIKAMEAASVILAIISAAMQIAMKMVDIFSNEKKVAQEEITMYHNQMDALDALIDKQHELLESTSALNAELYGENLRQTYQREIAATEQIAKKYAEEHGKGEHSLGYQLGSASSKYGVNSKGDLYNKGYAGLTNEQIEDATNSTAGIISWVKQMSAEEYADFRTTRFFAELTSKNSKFAESLDTINGKVQEIANIDDIELQVKTQTDLDEVAENLTDLATNAEATAKDIGDSFQSTMHNAMKAILKDKILTNGLEQWYKEFAAAMTDSQLTEGEADRLRTSYEEKVSNAQKMWQEMNKVAGFDLGSNEDMTTMSGALANASQESIDLLAGQTNAVRVNQINMMDIIRQQLLATVAIQESTNGINTIVQEGFNTLAGKLQSSDIRAMGGI